MSVHLGDTPLRPFLSSLGEAVIPHSEFLLYLEWFKYARGPCKLLANPGKPEKPLARLSLHFGVNRRKSGKVHSGEGERGGLSKSGVYLGKRTEAWYV